MTITLDEPLSPEAAARDAILYVNWIAEAAVTALETSGFTYEADDMRALLPIVDQAGVEAFESMSMSFT
jgi:hypothetical protein